MAKVLRNSTTLTVMLIVCILSSWSLTLAAQDMATPSAADQPPQPSIDFYPADDSHPGYISVELKPGEEETIAVVLGNNGDVDFEAVTYAADAVTIRNGGFGLNDLEVEQSGPTTWLDYPTETLSTTAGEGIERQLTISVPEGTEPGEYVTGIAMQTADPVNEEITEGMFRFDQYYRTVIAIRIMVPGDLAPALEFGEPSFVVEGAVPAIAVPISNTGNQQANPSGEVRVTDIDGNIVLTAPIQMGAIYGGHETELWIGLGQPPPDGEYEITLVLTDDDKNLVAELEPTTFSVSSDQHQSATVESPITISAASAMPMPDADTIQFLAVEATIVNIDEPIANAQLSLIAKVDGVEIERFPISQSLALPNGETDVSARYIPMTGWTSGEWEFELLLETVEGSGAAVVVATQPIDVKVTVP